MAQTRDSDRPDFASFAWMQPPFMAQPFMSLFVDMNGKLLQGMTSAQREWTAFVHRRIKEDLAVPQQLMDCRTLADVQSVYAEYFKRAFEQYQEQSRKAAEGAKAATENVVEAVESRARDTTTQSRH